MSQGKLIVVKSLDGQELHIPANLIVGVVRCAYRDALGNERAAIQIVARTPPIDMEPHQVYQKLADVTRPSPLVTPGGGRPTLDASLLNFDRPASPALVPTLVPEVEDEDSGDGPEDTPRDAS